MRSFHWRWPAESPERSRRAAEIAAALDLPPALGSALANRGLDADAASDLVTASLKQCTAAIGEPDGIADAAALLLDATRQRGVGVLCDFDADGATAQAILVEALRTVSAPGANDPVVAVPERNSEGFGPNQRCLDEVAKAGVSCLAVLDCGTGAGPLLDQFHAATGIVPVVVDHHPPHGAQPPSTGAIVNPWIFRAPSPGEQGTLCAAALAWFLARAILRQAGLSAKETATVRKRITLYAALGTACDLMRLNRPFNRALVRAGVQLLRQTEVLPPGLAAICKEAGVSESTTADDFGWRIGPRLNAGSRMGSSALASLCLRERQPGGAQELAERLEACNQERVALGKKARQELDSCPVSLEAYAEGPVNLHFAEHATPGTVGLIASEIVRRFGWPSVALARRDDGVFQGSGRSALGFDIGAAVAAALERGILLSGGGHPSACGLSIAPARVTEFRDFLAERFADFAAQASEPPEPGHSIDAELDGASFKNGSLLGLAESQQKLEPWGQGLPRPLFGIRGFSVVWSKRSENGHLFLTLGDGERRFRATWWRPPSDWPERVETNGASGGEPTEADVVPRPGARLDLIGHVEVNEWNDRREGRVVILDARTPQA